MHANANLDRLSDAQFRRATGYTRTQARALERWPEMEEPEPEPSAPTRGLEWTQDMDDTLARMVQSGRSHDEIAVALQVTHDQVKKRKAKLGIRRRTCRRLTAADRREMVRRYEAGETMEAIARSMKRGSGSVSRVIKESRKA
jgi:hypothetical protein